MSPAGPQVLVQVADRLADAGVMGAQDGPSGGWVAQAVENRDALGRPQHQVEAGYGVAAMRAAKEFAGVGVAALKHPLEPGPRCFAFHSD
jgi:hypothetical protein